MALSFAKESPRQIKLVVRISCNTMKIKVLLIYIILTNLAFL